MSHSFDQDARTDMQRMADLDSLDVTISMYAVTDKQGDRRTRSVFRAEQCDWVAVEGTFRQFKADSGFSSFGPPSFEDEGEVWLVSDGGKPGAGVLRVAGAAEVYRTAAGAKLAWIWIHPLRRGSNEQYITRLVEQLRAEYGTVAPLPEDIVNNAFTPAGRRFLEKYFPAHYSAEGATNEQNASSAS